MLSGKEHEDAYGKCSDELLKLAKHNIDNHFSCVGLVERFDESLAMMSCMFAWKNVYYAKTNVSHKSQKATGVDKKTLNLIRKYNELDIDLYAYAAERFTMMTLSAGMGYAKQLKNIQRKNMLYKPVLFMNRVGKKVKRLIS